MGTYKSSYTGAEIDTAIGSVASKLSQQTLQNPELTPVEGKVSWDISHNFNQNVDYRIRRTSDNAEVYTAAYFNEGSLLLEIETVSVIEAGSYEITLHGVVED